MEMKEENIGWTRSEKLHRDIKQPSTDDAVSLTAYGASEVFFMSHKPTIISLLHLLTQNVD